MASKNQNLISLREGPQMQAAVRWARNGSKFTTPHLPLLAVVRVARQTRG